MEFYERFDAFKRDLTRKVEKEYGYYFEPLLEHIDHSDYTHWLWYFIEPYMGQDGRQYYAGIYLKKDRKLPNEIVDFIEVNLILHFGPEERRPLLRNYYR